MTPTVDATAVWSSGRTQHGRAKIARVQQAAEAITALEGGALCVYVAREDAAEVQAWVKGRTASGETA